MEKMWNVFSTFSGVLGNELRLNHKKFKLVGVSETDPTACSILRYRASNVRNFGDVSRLSEQDLPDFDVLNGSPPCTAWSTAGKQKGFDDERGDIILHMQKMIKIKRPKIIVFENVSNIVSHKEGDSFLKIVKTYCDIGYHVDFQILSGTAYGIPQVRKRIFFVFKRSDLVTEKDKKLGFIGDSDVVDRLKKKIIKDNLGIPLFNFGFPLSAKMPVVLLDDILEDNVDESFYVSDKKFKSIMKDSVFHVDKKMVPVVHQYDKFKLRKDMNAIDTNYGKGVDNKCGKSLILCACSKSTRLKHVDKRVRIDGTANTLSTGSGGFSQSTYNYIVDVNTDRVRIFTPTEVEKLMNWYPEWTRWGIDANGKKIEIPKTKRYEKCGNGVISRMTQVLFLVVEKHLLGLQ